MKVQLHTTLWLSLAALLAACGPADGPRARLLTASNPDRVEIIHKPGGEVVTVPYTGTGRDSEASALRSHLDRPTPTTPAAPGAPQPSERPASKALTDSIIDLTIRSIDTQGREYTSLQPKKYADQNYRFKVSLGHDGKVETSLQFDLASQKILAATGESFVTTTKVVGGINYSLGARCWITNCNIILVELREKKPNAEEGVAGFVYSKQWARVRLQRQQVQESHSQNPQLAGLMGSLEKEGYVLVKEDITVLSGRNFTRVYVPYNNNYLFVRAKFLDTSQDFIPVDESRVVDKDGKPLTQQAPKVELVGNTESGDLIVDADFDPATTADPNSAELPKVETRVGLVITNARDNEGAPVVDRPVAPTAPTEPQQLSLDKIDMSRAFVKTDFKKFTANGLYSIKRLERINDLEPIKNYVRLWRGEKLENGKDFAYHVCGTKAKHRSSELKNRAEDFMSGAQQVTDLIQTVYSTFDVSPEAFYIMALESSYFANNAEFVDFREGRRRINFCAPTSTACGPGQFIDGTARSLVAANPGLIFNFDSGFSRRVKRNGYRRGQETDDRQYLIPSMALSALYVRDLFYKFWNYPEFFPLAYHDGEYAGARTRHYAGGALQQTFCAMEQTEAAIKACMSRTKQLRFNEYQVGLEDMLRFNSQTCYESFDYTMQILSLRLAMRDLSKGNYQLQSVPKLQNVCRPGHITFPRDYVRGTSNRQQYVASRECQ